MPAPVQVRGWKAVAILLAFAGFALYTRGNAMRSLDTAAVDAIRPWIVARYSSDAMQTSGGRTIEQMSPAEQKAYADRIVRASRVEIKSIQARGMGDNIICRVEVLVDGKPPPDGKSVRYIRMKYSNLTGWTYKNETSEWLWRVKLW